MLRLELRRLIFLGLWAALPTPGQVGSAALYTEFENDPAPAVLQALKEEVDFLTSPNALRFEWRPLHENHLTTWPELAVVKFSGRCEILPSAVYFQPGQRLGWTHISDGEVLPFAEIDCDAVFAYLFRGLWLQPPQTRERILGRALARVTAHELLHILAGTIAHSDHGVDHPTSPPRNCLPAARSSGGNQAATSCMPVASRPPGTEAVRSGTERPAIFARDAQIATATTAGARRTARGSAVQLAF